MFKRRKMVLGCTAIGASFFYPGHPLLVEIRKSLDCRSARFDFIVHNFGVNEFNYPYPSVKLSLPQAAPLKIATPFKYLTHGPDFLDENFQRMALIVQREGGEGCGGERPCREILLVLKKTAGEIYEESFHYEFGSEFQLASSDWFLVKAFRVVGCNTLKTWSFMAPWSSSSRVDYITTYSVGNQGMAAISINSTFCNTAAEQVRRSFFRH
jgi:hypothetical protein